MRFLKKGLLTTIQDAGRLGYSKIGINQGGVMDNFSFKCLNILLKNQIDNPVIEMHFPAPEIEFEEDVLFALYGANFEPKINQKKLVNGKIYQAKKGQILKFERKNNGERCYLGFKGQLKTPKWLDSFSENQALSYPKTENIIEIVSDDCEFSSWGLLPRLQSKILRFVPDFNYSDLSLQSKTNLKTQSFIISKDSNRMGYRLISDKLELQENKQMVSAAVSKGTIQLLPDGQLIVLMADAQTTGGYPKLGYICSADISHLAQLGAGEKFILQAISQEEALSLLQQEAAYFNRLKLTLEIIK